MRHAHAELASIIDSFSKPKVLLFECITPFFSSIEKIYPAVEGCEFVGPNISPGQIVTDGVFGRGISVRHEDMMAISSPTNSLDIIFHADVLEHVPDYSQAMKECHRALKAGGVLLFTCPFFFIEENIIRAKIENGVVKHILDPAYHDNPISQTGSLVYTQHGWPFLEEIQEVGFEKVDVGLLWDPWQGILSTNNPYIEGQMWPLMFRCIKRND
jgi:SAM-dependent methyltransferase